MSATRDSLVNRILALLGGVLILATGVILATSSGASQATPATAVAAVDRVEIADFKFAPIATSVPVGTTITWTNRDSAPHTATSGVTVAPDGVFDTGIITKGNRKRVKLTKAGTFKYYCALHPFMQGSVIVT